MEKKLSVIVPTCRRDALLGRCLAALVTQDLPPEQYEILVVDDAGEESTRQLVEGWYEQWDVGMNVWAEVSTGSSEGEGEEPEAGHSNFAIQAHNGPDLRYLRVVGQHHGPAAARNFGWRQAAGEIIAFTDDDTIPWPTWLTTGLHSFRGEVAGVSGQVLVPISSPPTDYELDQTGLENSEFVTANCFYRRSLLSEIGGFDERFQMAWRGDSDLYFTVLLRGFMLSHAPTAIVVHPVQPATWGASIRGQKKTQYNALLYRKHPRLYRTYIQRSPPLHYYVILAALLVTGGGLLLDNMAVSVVAIFFWAFMVAGLAARRLKNTSRQPGHVVEMIITSMAVPILSIFWRLWGAIRFRTPFL